MNRIIILICVSLVAFNLISKTESNPDKEREETKEENITETTSYSRSTFVHSIPPFQLYKGLSQLKSASFSSFNRMSYFIDISHEFNEKLDEYLNKHLKHTEFTIE